MPVCSQARILPATYFALAGSSPTSTVARPGRGPPAATWAAISARIVAARALPSRSVAAMGTSSVIDQTNARAVFVECGGLTPFGLRGCRRTQRGVTPPHPKNTATRLETLHQLRQDRAGRAVQVDVRRVAGLGRGQ